MHQTNDIKTIDSTRLRYLIIPCISFIFFLIISVSSLNAQGVSRHQGAGLSCASCHQEAPPARAVPSARCLTCHGDAKKLAEKTNQADPNPHASPHLEPGAVPECGDCHHMHRPPEVSCSQCHPDFKFHIK